MPANLYASLTQFRASLPGLTSTDDDSLLMEKLEDASRMLDRATDRRYYPLDAVRYYDHPQDDRILEIHDDDLLAVTTFTTNNTSESVTSGQYYLMCGASYNRTPYNRIVMKRDGTRPNLLYSGTPQKANAVTGTWGYHDDWANAWANSGDTVAVGGYTAAATTLAVTSGGNFQRGQLVKIDSEYIYISSISSNNLTAERGINGSTAATHTAATVIYIYKPPREAQRVCLRLAGWLYRQGETPFTFELSTDADGRVVIPPNAPPEVHRFVKGHIR